MPTLAKRTYTLPDETVAEFEHAVASGQRSATVARLLREWLDEARRRELRDEIVSGCGEMAAEYLAVEREFHALEEEVERGAEARAASGRGGARPARSRRGLRAGR